ncbi:MAG: hypothetical protein R3F55_13860 [Alphaproteobacteria bacterium]
MIAGSVKPKKAVAAYHAELKKLKLQPERPLADDSEITESVLKAG